MTTAETIRALSERLAKREASQRDITLASVFLAQFARAIEAVEGQMKP